MTPTIVVHGHNQPAPPGAFHPGAYQVDTDDLVIAVCKRCGRRRLLDKLRRICVGESTMTDGSTYCQRNGRGNF